MKRENFKNKIGFILSCSGAAIGLGNIWLFSWKVGKYGGGAFLITYFIFMVLFAIVGLIGEISLGRMMKRGVLGVTTYFPKSMIGKIAPYISISSVWGIYTFYVIVFGWVLKYFCMYVTGDIINKNYESYFFNFAGTSKSIPWHLLGIILSVIIISLGISKGIEKFNKIVMPIMFILFIFLLFKSLTLKGAQEGIYYLLKPDWTKLLELKTWVMALGQAFFTVGISGSALLVYGSYLKKEVSIVDSVVKTCILDTVAALMAGFIIIPAAFAFNLDITSGPALLFITVPTIFENMIGGQLIGGLFFLSIIFAALSSAINLLEVPVDAFIDKFKVTRIKGSILVGSISFIIGLFLDININLFGNFADFTNGFLLPLGAGLILAIFFYNLSKEKIFEEINTKKNIGELIYFIGKYIFVPGTFLIILLGILYGSIG